MHRMNGNLGLRRRKKYTVKIFAYICLLIFGIASLSVSFKTVTGYITHAQFSRFYGKENFGRTKMNNECLEEVEFLTNIDATVKTELFCCVDWTVNDIMCSFFLKQNGFSDFDICRMPKDRFLVPKILYYVVFSKDSTNPPEFLFMHYLSILSARRYIKPWAIYFVSDLMPIGYWWSRVQSEVKELRFVFRKEPRLVDGNVSFVQHKSDIVRLQILFMNGGIYLDTDTIIINSLDPIRGYPLTMGLLDNVSGMGNAVILAERRSPFIREWYRSYFRYEHTWNGNSLKVPYELWRQNKKALHLETEMFYRPNWYETKKLFHEVGYKWEDKYAVHIWHRHGYVPREAEEIKRLNSTLGEIFRFIYYGSKEMV